MSDIPIVSAIEAKRLKVEAARAANKALAAKAEEAAEEARLDDELLYEEALAKAYADPAVGPARVVGGLIKGGGYVLLKWPDKVENKYFTDRGILKKDGLTTDLCAGLVARCRLFPSVEEFNRIMDRNPAAPVALANKLLDGMRSEALEGGKE